MPQSPAKKGRSFFQRSCIFPFLEIEIGQIAHFSIGKPIFVHVFSNLFNFHTIFSIFVDNIPFG